MTAECPDIPLTAKYPITEAAKLLGITARHLYRLAVAGKIRYTVSRRNGRKLFSGKEIIRYWKGY